MDPRNSDGRDAGGSPKAELRTPTLQAVCRSLRIVRPLQTSFAETLVSFNLSEAIDVLDRTPKVLHALLGGLGGFWTLNNYGANTFSPFDVVGHLIHGEQADWMVRVRIILEHGAAAPFEPFDRYAMYEASKGKSVADLLDSFASLRAKNVADLRALELNEEHLERRGTHPALGVVTLRELLATWVVHDLNHVHQIAKAMAYQYRTDVGPWREYLSILK